MPNLIPKRKLRTGTYLDRSGIDNLIAHVEYVTETTYSGGIDDTPVDGVTIKPISSNWAYDEAATRLANAAAHVADSDPHTGYRLESADHTQYIKHALVTAANDFLVGSVSGVAVKKTLTETQAILGIASIGARVYNSGTQAIPASSVTAITFDSERYDTDSIHNTGTNTSRLTCNTAGYYIITGHVEFASNNTGIRGVYIKLNNTTYLNVNIYASVPSSATQMLVSTIYNLEATDYVEVLVYQNSGTTLNSSNNANYSPEFMMQRIG